MPIRVALHHKTEYHYDRLINLGPQVVRLRPAPHTRTPIHAYSIQVQPEEHFINWQQDPFGNYLGRYVFPKQTRSLSVEVDLVAEMTVINPFDFFIDPIAESFPFKYPTALARELRPYLAKRPLTPLLAQYVELIPKQAESTVDYLVAINQQLQNDIQYTIRMEPGVQTPEKTLKLRTGSCRDSAWLLVNILRRLGLASRFVSGYLIQLKPDVKSLDGPGGSEVDFTDLHAWTEVFLPGAGWVGMDPTSGLMTGEGHIPLAATPEPSSAAPISGAVDRCKVSFDFDMSVTRIHEDPRVTKPYTDEQWTKVRLLGQYVDRQLQEDDVRLTMGGEPTFVSIDDMEGEEWNGGAVSFEKRRLSADLLKKLRERFAEKGGMLHYGQGKWYPGEPLPRYALACYWRKDGQPIWHDDTLIADESVDYGFDHRDANRFVQNLSNRLGIQEDWIVPAYEDALYYMWKEKRLPVNVDPSDPKLKDPKERKRISEIFERGLDHPTGYVMPLERQWWQGKHVWASGPWPVRSDEMFLLPGDSPLGLRLPLDSLSHVPEAQKPWAVKPDLMDQALPPLPDPELLKRQQALPNQRGVGDGIPAMSTEAIALQRTVSDGVGILQSNKSASSSSAAATKPNSSKRKKQKNKPLQRPDLAGQLPESLGFDAGVVTAEAPHVVRTALCIEPREGKLYVFMPPVPRTEDYLELVAQIEQTASELQMPVVLEGYTPEYDARLEVLKVTPDPGVIEVNVHPTQSWQQLEEQTLGVYEDAWHTRLGAEKFDLDGKHWGTGGGNHIVLGGSTPPDSPFLRRPALLKSMVAYWHNHPSLSYLFSGRFVGPTSQAPRMDEGRQDAVYEMQIAMDVLQAQSQDLYATNTPPWLVDRIFRNLLIDLTGNTHRAEFCIDKLYSPDSPTGRLGLLELRGFEMPPHAQMSLAQQLLIRALVAKFWRDPIQMKLVKWGTTLHDRFFLPHFVWQDFCDVIEDLNQSGFDFDVDWFAPHFEFRFPQIGVIQQQSVELELRTAIEPWHVLGEEPGAGGTVRYVDSSLERLQVRVRGITETRHAVTVNGRPIPLHPTGRHGEWVAGVRYRAWQPPSCLHPTIPAHTPLVFDLVDQWQNRSLGGCTYFVEHPGGRNSDRFPVNAFEAEARRASRFTARGHTPGHVAIKPEGLNPSFPMTLDLRCQPQHVPDPSYFL